MGLRVPSLEHSSMHIVATSLLETENVCRWKASNSIVLSREISRERPNHRPHCIFQLLPVPCTTGRQARG